VALPQNSQEFFDWPTSITPATNTLKIPFFPSITLYYNIYYQKRKDHPAKKSAERQTRKMEKSVYY